MAKNLKKYNPVASGVAIPGLTDSQKGIWTYSPFSKIANVPISHILSEKLSLRVFAENDVNACAIGEKVHGICKNDSDFLWITISNGIGGALYLNNSLYSGSDGNAGEIGHIIVEENTEMMCGCGKSGCLEAMTSGTGIEKMYFNLCNKKLTAKEIAHLVANGNEAALDVYRQAGYYIGKAIAHTVNILNIRKVVIGGGVSQSFDLLKEYIDISLERYLFSSANKHCKVEKTGLGYYAALIGAASVAQMKIK